MLLTNGPEEREIDRSSLSTGGEAGYALPFFGATIVPSLSSGLALVSRTGEVDGNHVSPYLGAGFAYLTPVGRAVYFGYDVEYRYHWNARPNESHHQPSFVGVWLVLGLRFGVEEREGEEGPTSFRQ